MISKKIFKTLFASFAGFILCYLVFVLIFGFLDNSIGQQAGSIDLYNLLRGNALTYEVFKASSLILILINLIPLINYIKSFLVKVHVNFNNKYTLPVIFMTVGFFISLILINSGADFKFQSLTEVLFYFFLTGYLYESFELGRFSFAFALDLIFITFFYVFFYMSLYVYTATVDQLSDLPIIITFILQLITSTITTFSLLFSIYLLKSTYKFSFSNK